MASCATSDGTVTGFDPTGSTMTLTNAINEGCDRWLQDRLKGREAWLRPFGGRNITSFDPPGSTSTGTGQLNVNGDIAGSYADSSGLCHGFIRAADGTFTIFDTAGSTATYAVGINKADPVSGGYADSSGVGHGYLRTSDGTVTSFDPPGSIDTFANRINDHMSWLETGAIVRAFSTASCVRPMAR